MGESETETTSKIVWFELPAEDTTRAREFYSKLRPLGPRPGVPRPRRAADDRHIWGSAETRLNGDLHHSGSRARVRRRRSVRRKRRRARVGDPRMERGVQ